MAGHHDGFVRWNLNNLDTAGKLLKLFLTDPRLKGLDLDALDLDKECYVDENLSELVTDLLYKAPFEGEDSCVSVLVEHKSEGTARVSGANLPFQLRCQEMGIMKHHQRNNRDGMMPVVVLVGLYHGATPYSGPLRVSEKIKGPKKLVGRRWCDQDMILIDLASYCDEQLAVGGKLGIFLLVLKHIYDKNVLDIVWKLVPEMQKVDGEKDGRDFLISVITYLFETREEKKEEIVQIAVQSLSKETGEGVMTIADRLRREQAEEIALAMVAEGIDLETVVRCTGLTKKDLESLEHRKAS